jgi:hypothetical protein
MRRITVVILVLLLALGAFGNRRRQDDWTGGPGDTEPDTAWGDTFYTSSSVNFYYFEQLWLAFSPNLTPDQEHIGNVNGAYYVKAGYIDLDSYMDVVVSSSDANIFVWFRNLGNGVFDSTPRSIVPNQWAAFNIVDLNDDGYGDIIIGIDNPHPAHLSWLENDGDGNFAEHVVDPSFTEVDLPVAVDFDKDGDLDLFAGAYQSSPLRWYENHGDETFDIHTLVSSGHYGAENIGLTKGDLNGDGWTDVAFSCRGNGEVVWWEYLEDWTDPTLAFTEHVIYTGMTEAYTCVAFDMDWDQDLDLVTSSRNGRIDWFENDGAGNFTNIPITSGYSGCREVYPIDADYDGDIDILGATETGDSLDWWENDGDMNFTQRSWTTSYNGAHGVRTGNVTDTKAPIAISTARIADTVDWWAITEGFRDYGTLDSAILECEFENPNWSTFTWVGYEEAGTDIAFYVRGGSDVDDLLSSDWDGPFYDQFDVGEQIGDGTRYFQYKVELTSDDPEVSPSLYQVDVYYSDGDVGADPIVVEAATHDEGVLVSWTAEGEFGSLDLFRAPAGDGDRRELYVRLNELPLPASSPGRYLDYGVEAGAGYAYLIRAVDSEGVVSEYGPAFAVAGGDGELNRPVLEQSHPNPATGLTTIPFSLPEEGPVELAVYDLSGRRVTTLVAGELAAGRHEVELDAAALTPGVYLYRLTTGDATLMRRMVVTR